jgi:tape measure domain-containing protein
MRAMGKSSLFFTIFGNDKSKKAFDSFNKNANSAQDSVKKLAGVVAAAFSVREIVEASNVMIGVTNRMNALTDSATETASAMNHMRRIASDSRSDFDAVAMLFTRLSLATEHLGATQRDVADATQTVANTFIIAGSHAQEANNSARQLAQGLASGALRGDELRSVMENNTILTKMLADGLNMTIGELRAFGHAGKLTAETVMPILIAGTKQTNEEIQKMPMTLGQAGVALRNNFQFMIGDIEDATGAFSTMAKFVGHLANNMDALLIPALVAIPPIIYSIAGALNTLTVSFLAFAATNPFTAFVVGATLAITAIYIFRDEIIHAVKLITQKWLPFLVLKKREAFLRIGTFLHDLLILPFRQGFRDAFNSAKEELNKFIRSFNKIRSLFGFGEDLPEFDILGDVESAKSKNKKKIDAVTAAAQAYLDKKIEKTETRSILDVLLGRDGKDGGDDKSGFGAISSFEKFLKAAEDGYGKFAASIKSMQDEINDIMKQSYDGLTNLTMEFLEKGRASFKDFATSIVRELIRIAVQKLVIDKMFASFGGLIGKTRDRQIEIRENLNLPSILPSNEGGGFTGMGARAGGLDNKGGFLSILHPNETVIDHTKAQPRQAQQSAPTVNFNISTVDAAGFDQLLTSRKGLITQIINNAMNTQGKMGIV